MGSVVAVPMVSSQAELAQMLSVEEDELQPRPDPQQYAEEQRHLRRSQARGSDFNLWTGRLD
jgi:hypothetical protein